MTNEDRPNEMVISVPPKGPKTIIIVPRNRCVRQVLRGNVGDEDLVIEIGEAK